VRSVHCLGDDDAFRQGRERFQISGRGSDHECTHGAGFAVYRQDKAAKDGGVTRPVCTMYEASIKYPLDLFLASDTAPDYLLGAELHGDAVPMTNYRTYPLGLARTL
jgi:hypothetical protein